MTKTEGGIWLYHQFWPWGQFSMSNEGKTLFLNENPYFWLLIWNEREISRQKWPVEKWFLRHWKGKKLRSNVWETTRCPVSELTLLLALPSKKGVFNSFQQSFSRDGCASSTNPFHQIRSSLVMGRWVKTTFSI